MQGLSLVAASGGHSSSRCAGLSLSRPLLLRSTGSRRAGSVVVAHGPSCSAVCGIFPDQGSNPYPLHWQADSQPLRHQGSPCIRFYMAPFTQHTYFEVHLRCCILLIVYTFIVGGIPLYGYTTNYLSIHLVMDIWAIFILGDYN